MRHSGRSRTIIASGLLALATLLGHSQARASSYCSAPSYRVVWVTTDITRQVPSTRYVTLYDHCGRPYRVARTIYETVEVPVRKRVLLYD